MGNQPNEAPERQSTNLAMIRLENDTMTTDARSHPRDYKEVLTKVLQQIEAYPSFAREAMYAKPVGTEKVNGREVTKFARGPSIRMAEAIAEAYGRNRISLEVEPIDDLHARLTASFFDFENLNGRRFAAVVSRQYKARGGRTVTMPEDRFYDLKVKAEGSKLIRECILRAIPSGLRSEVIEAATNKIASLLDDKTVEQIVAQYSTKNVTEEDLARLIGSKRGEWTIGDRSDLLMVWNAINAGECTVTEVFGQDGPKEVSNLRELADTLRGQPPSDDGATGAGSSNHPQGPENGDSAIHNANAQNES